MSSFRIRPRFKIQVKVPVDKLVDLLKSELKNTEEASCVGSVMEHYAVIKIPLKDRHFWSPQLSLSYDELNGETEIRGLYGPNPTVWAVFFFGYATLGIIALFLLVIGFSRYSLEMGTDIFWGLPIVGILALILYLIAQGGQKIGASDMYTLHHFFEETIHKKVRIDVI